MTKDSIINVAMTCGLWTGILAIPVTFAGSAILSRKLSLECVGHAILAGCYVGGVVFCLVGHAINAAQIIAHILVWIYRDVKNLCELVSRIRRD